MAHSPLSLISVGGHRWPTRPVVAAVTALIVLAACSSGGAKPTPRAGPASTAPPSIPISMNGYVAGATYFGHAWPLNFWSSDLSQVPTDFRRIRADGFNTVALVLPWGEFQPGLTPPRYDDRSFSRLESVIRQARSAGLAVILRLGYDWDLNPGKEELSGDRLLALFKSQPVYQAWLDYISEVRRRVAGLSNVRSAFITWEDLWSFVVSAQGTTNDATRVE